MGHAELLNGKKFGTGPITNLGNHDKQSHTLIQMVKLSVVCLRVIVGLSRG